MIVQQALHGYDGGHRLLSASFEPVAAERSSLDSLSDLSGYLPRGFLFDDYLTGYPCGRFYVLASTWPDLAGRRGGTVLTHSLLFPLGEIGNVVDLLAFATEFRRPEGPQDAEPYTRTLELTGGAETPSWHVEEETVMPVASALFSQPKRPVVEFADIVHPLTVRWLWQRLWPEARRRFAFCTMGLQPRYIESRPFEYLCAPTKAREAFLRDAWVVRPGTSVAERLSACMRLVGEPERAAQRAGAALGRPLLFAELEVWLECEAALRGKPDTVTAAQATVTRIRLGLPDLPDDLRAQLVMRWAEMLPAAPVETAPLAALHSLCADPWFATVHQATSDGRAAIEALVLSTMLSRLGAHPTGVLAALPGFLTSRIVDGEALLMGCLSILKAEPWRGRVSAVFLQWAAANEDTRLLRATLDGLGRRLSEAEIDELLISARGGSIVLLESCRAETAFDRRDFSIVVERMPLARIAERVEGLGFSECRALGAALKAVAVGREALVGASMPANVALFAYPFSRADHRMELAVVRGERLGAELAPLLTSGEPEALAFVAGLPVDGIDRLVCGSPPGGPFHRATASVETVWKTHEFRDALASSALRCALKGTLSLAGATAWLTLKGLEASGLKPLDAAVRGLSALEPAQFRRCLELRRALIDAGDSAYGSRAAWFVDRAVEVCTAAPPEEILAWLEVLVGRMANLSSDKRARVVQVSVAALQAASVKIGYRPEIARVLVSYVESLRSSERSEIGTLLRLMVPFLDFDSEESEAEQWDTRSRSRTLVALWIKHQWPPRQLLELARYKPKLEQAIRTAAERAGLSLRSAER